MSYYDKGPTVIEQGTAVALIAAFLFAIVLVISGALSLLTGLVVYLGWNHGAVNFVEACGGSVGGISYWTAFFTAWFTGAVAALFKGAQVNATTSS